MEEDMSDKKNGKILVIEHDPVMGQRIEALLIHAGYEVRWVNSSYAAIAALESSSDSPFALVISAYQLPRMGGDELLEHTRAIAPDTQRMLFAEESEMDALINAINRSVIHGCIITPFDDQQLISEVSKRCEQFRFTQKRASLKKLTEHQNRQMYKLIVNMKKRKTIFEQQIKEKNRQLQILTAYKASVLQSGVVIDASLNPDKKESIDSKISVKEFGQIANSLKLFMENIIFDNTLKLKDVDEFLVPGIFEKEQQSASLLSGTNPINLESGTPWAGQVQHNFTDRTVMEKESVRVSFDKDLIDKILNLFFQYELLKLCSTECQESFIPSVEETVLLQSNQEEKMEHQSVVEKDIIKSTATLPVDPVNARIRYFFKTNSHNKGQVRPDEAIDFNSAGDKIFVSKDMLLAEKIPFKKGVSGKDSYGRLIPVAEPDDLLFNTGINTRFSEDRLRIFATSDGQPHLDIMGAVSVLPEMQIQGDADSDTGDLNFNGNIVVKGIIRAGFKVKCANLTAQAVEGAQIHLTGSLSVFYGIINSDTITVQGDVQARYIKNSKIKALGDIVVQEEITGSELFAGGQCINADGLIVSSFVNARQGMIAGRVGTEKSVPSKLEIGTDGIVEMMIADLDERIEKKSNELKELQDALSVFEAEEKILHEKISDAAHIQDRAQMELINIEKLLPKIEASEDINELQRVFKEVKKLKSRSDASEKIIFDSFERQDNIVEMSAVKQREIDKIENQIEKIRLKQRGIKEFSMRGIPKAELTIHQHITSNNIVTGAKSTLLVKEKKSYCKIHEVVDQRASVQGHGLKEPVYQMVITSLKATK